MSEVTGPPILPPVEQAPPVTEPECVVVQLGLACIMNAFGDPTPPIGEEHPCQVVRRIHDKNVACNGEVSLQPRKTELTTDPPVRLTIAQKPGTGCLDTQITLVEQALELVRWAREDDPEEPAEVEDREGDST